MFYHFTKIIKLRFENNLKCQTLHCLKILSYKLQKMIKFLSYFSFEFYWGSIIARLDVCEVSAKAHEIIWQTHAHSMQALFYKNSSHRVIHIYITTQNSLYNSHRVINFCDSCKTLKLFNDNLFKQMFFFLSNLVIATSFCSYDFYY